MPSQIIISVAPWDVRAALVEDGRLAELYLERPGEQDPTGNIYKGRVLKVRPGMAAAFLDVGLDKAAYLFAPEAASSWYELQHGWLDGEQDDSLAGEPPRLPAGSCGCQVRGSGNSLSTQPSSQKLVTARPAFRASGAAGRPV